MSNHESGGNEAAILRIFEQGKRFSEELLKENERLRMLVARLRTEGQENAAAELRLELARVNERLRMAEDDLGRMRKDNAELRRQFHQVEDENREFADRYMDVEQLYSNLIHLYVANDRLHSTLDCREVIQIVKEIVVNMVGAHRFGIYLTDHLSASLVLVAQEELGPEHASIPLEDPVVGRVVSSGQLYVAESGEPLQQPQACVPLKIRGRVLGVIVIFDLLSHKMGLESRDLEMFELLSSHAACAIYSASLSAISQPDRPSISAMIEVFQHQAERMPPSQS